MRLKTLTQQFNDGIVDIYSVGNIAEPGNMPKDGLKQPAKAKDLRFEERIVGMSRFWTALQENARIEKLLRVPKLNSVTSHDVAILDGKQFKIVQIQYPKDVYPSCMDLSLETLEVAYEIK